MSSKNNEQRICMTSRKASPSNNGRPFTDRKDTKSCVESLSSRIDRIEGMVNNFYKNLPIKKATERFDASGLSNITLKELQKLAKLRRRQP